jgi:hypothetical protein
VRSRTRWLNPSACAFALLVASRSAAQETATTAPHAAKRAAVLLFSGCGVEGAPPRAVSEVLSLELDAANVRLKGEDEGFGSGDLLLVVRGGCEASEPLTLRASLDGAQRERSLLLDDVPDSVRARTLALSLAELGELVIFGAPAERPATTAENPAPGASPTNAGTEAARLTAEPKPRPPSVKAPTKPASPVIIPDEDRRELFEKPADPEPVRSRNYLSMNLVNRWFGFEQPTWGGRARLDIASVFLGGEALYGEAATDIGSVEGLIIDGFMGLRLFSLATGRVNVDMASRVGAGAVNVSGAPADDALSSSMIEIYLDAALVGDCRLHLVETVSTSLSVELGAARGIVALADGTRVSEFGGFFLGASLGLGFGL